MSFSSLLYTLFNVHTLAIVVCQNQRRVRTALRRLLNERLFPDQRQNRRTKPNDNGADPESQTKDDAMLSGTVTPATVVSRSKTAISIRSRSGLETRDGQKASSLIGFENHVAFLISMVTLCFLLLLIANIKPCTDLNYRNVPRYIITSLKSMTAHKRHLLSLSGTKYICHLLNRMHVCHMFTLQQSLFSFYTW